MPATDKYFHNIKTMHVVFALSSVALLATTLWMMEDDHNRGWPAHQREFFKIEALKARAGQQAISDPEYAEKVKQLEEAIAKYKIEAEKLDRTELITAERAFGLAERITKTQRQVRGVASANYGMGIRDDLPPEELQSLLEIYQRETDAVNKLESELQQKEAARDEAQKKLDQQIAATGLTKAEEGLKTAQEDYERLQTSLVKIEPDTWLGSAKRTIMEWYIIDGFNSHLKIENDWLPDLEIKLGMAKSARFDRCRTCHLGIDRTDGFDDYGNIISSFPHGSVNSDHFEDWVADNQYPHPYSTHPRPELFVTSGSPHPATEGATKFGCTVCHEGQGSGTNFSNAAHYPNDPHQHEVWDEEYGFKTNHFWEYPMLPQRFAEASCIKCHHQVEELGANPKFGATAPKVFKGYKLIEKYGCFGCHQIQGYEAGKSIGPDFRLEPGTPEEAKKIAAGSNLIAGRMRKVGPSLMHVKSKTFREWIEYWTEEPKLFRPATRMPQFFNLSNQHDAFAGQMQPVEIAGVTQYLLDNSQDLKLESPPDGYQPNAKRGKDAFSFRGCLNCHTHKEFPDFTDDFGPDLSRLNKKINPGSEGFNWVYTWILEPGRHHPRTKMPNLYINSDEKLGLKRDADGNVTIDPAADIAEYLLKYDDPNDTLPEYDGERIIVDEKSLDELVLLFVKGSKVLKDDEAQKFIETRRFPIDPKFVKGDEIELTRGSDDGSKLSDGQWRDMLLNYVGRRTISRYGCYGCHDIAGFEQARPIGTTLQDWGRKDTTKLALEHIEEHLHHHGEPDGSSTHLRAVAALKSSRSSDFPSEEIEESEKRLVYFYGDLLHHGRAGFLFQKLRQPRSYDYKKIETKGYDERLRMPKFPFSEEEVEAIATFVLGLVAEPPASQYLYQPDVPVLARNEGERLLRKYNCTGCHVIELPEVAYYADGLLPDNPEASELQPEKMFSLYDPEGDSKLQGYDLLKKLKPPREALRFSKGGRPIIHFRGLKIFDPDPDEDPEDQLYIFNSWENLTVDGKLLTPLSKHSFAPSELVNFNPGRGGDFARLLVKLRSENTFTEPQKRNIAWQESPPPLYQEGMKVQTPWLYQFLREPTRLRHTTVLRMPKFNMSNQEAQSLANYFAAVDGVAFPYQDIPQRDPDYLPREVQGNPAAYPKLSTNDQYLAESWKLLHHQKACINCHTVGGNKVKIGDPQKDIQGPNLDLTTDRLRPDWVMLWLYQPAWITPYTSMPALFSETEAKFNLENLTDWPFGGRAGVPSTEAVGVRDALMNYHRLLEQQGKVEILIPTLPVTAAAGEN
jgi:mono/diheme cytochrome c family protein